VRGRLTGEARSFRDPVLLSAGPLGTKPGGHDGMMLEALAERVCDTDFLPWIDSTTLPAQRCATGGRGEPIAGGPGRLYGCLAHRLATDRRGG